ncbi:MAG TPA: nodulation protein NfeD [Ktedonobacteraceae bacterium]|nr:nodulation protein NfeD [Ktedonobacteraceae bacterium]
MYLRHVHRTTFAFALIFLGALIVALFSFVFTARPVAAASQHVDVMVLNTAIGPASLQYLTTSISTAEQDGAQALVMEIDTPGGDIDSMKAMVEAELASTVPIIAYVSPTGGYAASAGAFVALAAQVVAMAPTTRIGASSPINSDGSDIGSTLKSKIENDLVASMTGIQTRYGRNIALATRMVTNAASYDDATAESQGIVDLGAANLTDLLNKVNGRFAKLDSGSVMLQTAGDTVVNVNPSFWTSFYGFIIDPNVTFLLFIVALIGIFLEIAHPGAIFPGTVGGIALILFLFAAGSLMPNWAGLGLMVLAFVLLVLDLRLPTHGILTVGAIISLIFGSLIFFNSGGPYNGPQLNPFVLYVISGLIGIMSFSLIAVIVRTQRNALPSGVTSMIGAKAIALTPLLPEGRVNYGGENWAAVLAGDTQLVDAGTEVQIVAIEGLRLYVQPLYAQSTIDTFSAASLE